MAHLSRRKASGEVFPKDGAVVHQGIEVVVFCFIALTMLGHVFQNGICGIPEGRCRLNCFQNGNSCLYPFCKPRSIGPEPTGAPPKSSGESSSR